MTPATVFLAGAHSVANCELLGNPGIARGGQRFAGNSPTIPSATRYFAGT